MANKLYIDIDKAVGIGYLSDWYQNSIDDTKPPIWTDEHIYELVNDFLIIPNDTPTADVVEVKQLKIIRDDLKWWLNTNSEKGVVYIPEYIVENMIAKIDGGKAND